MLKTNFFFNQVLDNTIAKYPQVQIDTIPFPKRWLRANWYEGNPFHQILLLKSL